MRTGLEYNWFELASNYSQNAKQVAEIYGTIRQAYSGTGRYYHTLEHIKDLLALSKQYHESIVDKNTIDFAIWFHDIVYDVTSGDNELKSAEFAALRLKQLEVPDDQILDICQFILATKDHMLAKAGKGEDLGFLLDFDMAILSVDWEEYKEYTISIRKEYAVFPDKSYYAGRRAFIEKTLKASSIYYTRPFIAREPLARENLERELHLLQVDR